MSTTPTPTPDPNAWIDHIIDMQRLHIKCLKGTPFSVYLMRPLGEDEVAQDVQVAEDCIAALELAKSGTNPFAMIKARAFKQARDILSKEEKTLHNELSSVRSECIQRAVEFRKAFEEWVRVGNSESDNAEWCWLSVLAEKRKKVEEASMHANEAAKRADDATKKLRTEFASVWLRPGVW